MLKDVPPEEQWRAIDDHQHTIEPFVYFGTLVGCFTLYFLHTEVLNSLTFIFIIGFVLVAEILSHLLVIGVWFPFASYLGHMDTREAILAILQPNSYPRLVQRFLEGWWQNVFVLDVFIVVFRIVLSLGLYRLVGPMLGIL